MNIMLKVKKEAGKPAKHYVRLAGHFNFEFVHAATFRDYLNAGQVRMLETMPVSDTVAITYIHVV